ncbi:MAG: tetratricopeptide repeat protein [Planctomycetes bacterium]|nr:tetratricopeptide repeat protein [Planctomycetota bacterium]MBI3843119.1 tetratricopeptide repeat protein [Planctomycetota bacterium]
MDTDKHIQRAEAEAKRRNFDYAINLYREILNVRPDLVRAREGLRAAEIRRLEGKDPSAWMAKMKGAPALSKIAMLRTTKQWEKVLGACEDYLVHDPKNGAVNTQLGEAAIALGDHATALFAYRTVAQWNASDIAAWKSAGTIHANRGEIPEALECFEKALAIDPKDPEAQKARKNLAAESALRAGRFDSATSSRDLARDKGEIKRLQDEKKIVRSQEDVEGAIKDTEAALQGAPHDVDLLQRLADLYRQHGNLKEAIEVLAEANAIAPDSYDLLVKLGDLRIREIEERVRDARERASAGDEAAFREAGDLERQKVERQIEEFGKRCSAHPTDLGLRFEYGDALLRGGRVDESIAEFQQAVRDPRGKSEALAMLGFAFFKKGLLDLAEKQFRAALEGIGEDGARAKEIHYAMGAIHERRGSIDRALEEYGKVYEKEIGYKDVSEKVESLGRRLSEGNPSKES